MKKIMKYFVLMFIFLLVFSCNVKALSVSKNEITIEKGTNDSVELYANVEANVTSVSFDMTYTTYDVPADFSASGGISDSNPGGPSHIITFSEAKTGSILLGTINIRVKDTAVVTAGVINITNGKATDVDGNTINLNMQSITVKVGIPVVNNTQEETTTVEETKEEKKEEPKKEEEVKKEIDKNMLDKIESKIVKINLRKNVFEYTVSVSENVEELDLKPIAKDEDSKIEISTQKIKDIKDNKIIISVTNGDVKQDYIINIKIKKAIKEVTIDKSEFVENSNYKSKWIIIIITLVIIFLASILLTKKK